MSIVAAPCAWFYSSFHGCEWWETAVEKFFSAIQEAIVFSNEVKGLADEIKELDSELRSVDKRLIRVETLLEIAQKFGTLDRHNDLDDGKNDAAKILP